MATVRNDGRPARRSTGQPWLDRKYSQKPTDPRLAGWADAVFADHLHAAQGALPVGPFRSEDAAKRAKNALYDAVYKRWNPAHPDEEFSLSANITDPADGRCYARGQCRCEQNGCTPTPGPGWYVHARLHSKRDGRAHQASKPRESWDYDPLAPRRRGADDAGPVPAPEAPDAGAPASRPGERFGRGRQSRQSSVPSDGPTWAPKVSGGGSPRRKPESKQDPQARGKAGEGVEQPEHESLLTRIRRSIG